MSLAHALLCTLPPPSHKHWAAHGRCSRTFVDSPDGDNYVTRTIMELPRSTSSFTQLRAQAFQGTLLWP